MTTYDDVKHLFSLINDNKWKQFIDYLTNNKDIDVNIRDSNGNYLIMYAVKSNKLDVVELLIKRGAKLDILIDKDKHSLLYTPIKNKHDKMLQLILKYNKTTVGLNILDIIDSTDNTPLHYAIHEKNVNMISIMLSYGANVNDLDVNGLNSLHIAVLSKDLEVVKLIVSDKRTNINSVIVDTGESALHLACNLELDNIAKLLLNKGINPDITDKEYGYTALNYAVTLNNLQLVKLIIEHKANINLQDNLGNTVLHHSIKDHHYLLVDLLISSPYTTDKINFNLHNIEDKLPIHIMLESKPPSNTNTINTFVQHSNLNHQDIDNNTALHYLTKANKNLWKISTIKKTLGSKKMNIFLQNKKGERPIDSINKSDMTEFINLVTDSYLYILRNTGFIWKETWQNLCGKKMSYNNMSQDEMEVMRNYVNIRETKGDLCREIVKNRLTGIINGDDTAKCGHTSYPHKKNKRCIVIKEQQKLEFCTFTGATMDVLFGLIYLLMKHSNACSTLDREFVQNTELCDFYSDTYVRAGADNTNKKVGLGCHFINFEIVWSYHKLFFSSNFEENFDKCADNDKKRFTVIPLGIELEKGGHANYIIYDKRFKEVERFEPYGSGVPYGFDYKPDMLDKLLSKRFKEIDESIRYVSPGEYMPKIGFQYFDAIESSSSKVGDPGGFCALWSLWYTDQRLTYPDVDRRYLIEQLLKNIKIQNLSFKNLIRNYSDKVIQIRDSVLNKAGITINDWVNDEYTEEQYIKIIKGIVLLVQKNS